MGRKKRGWKAAAALSLDDLRRMVAEKHASLTARRTELATELAAVDADLAAAGAAPAEPDRKPARRGPGRPRKARRGPGRPRKAAGAKAPKASKGKRGKGKRRGRKAGPKGQSDLHNAIRAALGGSSEPLKLADIAAKVSAGGYKTKSSHFPVIVGQRLTEMKDVKKAGRGLYTLR